MPSLLDEIADFDALLQSEVGQQWQQVIHQWDALRNKLLAAMVSAEPAQDEHHRRVPTYDDDPPATPDTVAEEPPPTEAA